MAERTLHKDTLRLIRATRGRFLSLTAIVTLGMAFFVGVSASSRFMSYSVDSYSDSLNLKDITVYSNYGFDEDDIDAIRALPQVKDAEGAKFVDVIAASDRTTLVTRIHSYQKDASINQFSLREGRLPENENEVLGEAGTDLDPGLAVGTVVKLSRPDNDLSDWLKVDTVTVVGTIDTPLYLNETKENSTLSNQYIATYFYIPEEAFAIDYDTEVNVLTTQGKQMNSFSSRYADYDLSVKETIESLGSTQAAHRKDAVVADANEKYQDGLQKYNDSLQEYNDKIADAEQQLQDAAQKIADGRKELSDGIAKLQDSQRELDEQSISGQNQIHAARDEIARGEASLKENQKLFEQKKTEYEALIQQIDDGIAGMQAALDSINAPAFKGSDPLSALSLNPAVPESLKGLISSLGLKDDSTIDDLIQRISDTRAELVQLQASIQPDQLKKMGLSESLPVVSLSAAADSLKTMGDTLAGMQAMPISAIPDEALKTQAAAAAAAGGLPADTDTATLAAVLHQEADAMAQLYGGLQSALPTLDMNTASFTEASNALSAQIAQLDTASAALAGMISASPFSDDALLNDVLTAMPAAQQASFQQLLTTMNLDPSINTVGEFRTAVPVKTAELQAQRKQITDGIAEGEQQLADGAAKLAKGYEQTVNASVELDQKVADAQRQINDGWNEIDDNRQKLADAEQDLADGRQELADQKADGAQKLADAKADLDKAEQDIQDLEAGSWTVLDRSQHYASETYRNSVNQMAAIANIFPVFFFFVAALVCLTTMSRMIDEQRGQLGILRALGYTHLQCASIYLFYAVLATVIGIVLGTVIGLLTFPAIIYNAWNMMYVQPKMKLYVPWSLVLLSGAAFLAVMILTTWNACWNDMREVPSQLMRPKAPKLGRSTFIEKVPLLWSHMSFTWKVTVRNLIRYKKRLFMTVIGVAGCTALLITGFGVKDSVNSMVNIQFDEIELYDGLVHVKDEVTASEVQTLADQIRSRDDVDAAVVAASYSAKVSSSASSSDDTAFAQVFDSADTLKDLYHLRTRVGHRAIELGDDGVVINEKLSDNLHLKIGDQMTIESDTGVRREVTVTGICENYIQHYVFMTQAYYEKVFGTAKKMDTIMIRARSGIDLQAMKTDLAASSQVKDIQFYDTILNNFHSMVKSLDLIVWVLIISSMSLAFVVLGNLTNINISERAREIATLKVLGFRRREVEKYIYKENNVLTIIGSLVGIPIGRLLHHYVMGQVEMDYIMFGREVLPAGIFLSVVLTIGFGLLVNLFMRRKLADIEMVESLKSVE